MKENEYLLRLSDLINKRQWDDAYVFFCENKQQYSKSEQKRLTAILLRQDTASSYGRTTLLLLIFTAIFQLLSSQFFQNQIQDLFAFVGAYFRPYMYVSSLLFLILGIVFDIVLFRLCYVDLIWTRRLLSRPILKRKAVGIFALFTFLLGFSLYQTVPLLQDLPVVVDGRYAVGIVTREQHLNTVYGNAYVHMGKEPLVADFDPTPWLSTPRWSDALMPIMPGLYNRWVRDIYVNGETYQMGGLQLQMMGYEELSFPVTIEYLPNSGLILWISYGGE